jgi:hypothetical protein
MTWAAVIAGVSGITGVAQQFALALCLAVAVKRAHQALMDNRRYHFTTWRWGQWLLLLLAFGYALKLAATING